MNEITTVPSAGLMPTDLDQAMRLASFMAKAKTVPAHLQDSPGDCLMVIEASMRWQMSPFAVAQCTSVIQGKLMFEGKLVAAVIETSGGIVGHLDYEFEGVGAERSITVSAVRRGETAARTVTVALKDARTNNGIWNKQPDQQLVYHATRVWARRWLPAVMLGVYSPEEMPEPPFNGTTLEAKPEAAPEPQVSASAANPFTGQQGTAAANRFPVQQGGESRLNTAAAAAMPRGDRKRQTIAEWLEAHRIALHDCQSAAAVDAILESDEVQTARQKFTNGAKQQLDDMISEALNKWYHAAPEEPTEEELPDLAEIALP